MRLKPATATVEAQDERCTALCARSVQRLAGCTLHVQDVVTIEFDIEEVERIPTVGRLEDDAGPIYQLADWHQETINVDGMQSREAKIGVRRILAQSTAPYENRQVRLANPFARHAVQGVADHCLDRREAPKTHRNLVAHCQGFDRPIALARPDLRAPRKAIAATLPLLPLPPLPLSRRCRSVAIAVVAWRCRCLPVQSAGRQERTHQTGCLQRIAPRTIDLRSSAHSALPTNGII